MAILLNGYYYCLADLCLLHLIFYPIATHGHLSSKNRETSSINAKKKVKKDPQADNTQSTGCKGKKIKKRKRGKYITCKEIKEHKTEHVMKRKAPHAL